MNKMRTATKAKHEIPGARTDREPGRENPGGAPSAVRARIGFDVAEITSCCRSEQRTPVGLLNHPANHTWRYSYATGSNDRRDPYRSEDRAVHLGAAKASEMAPCPGRTRGSWNHTVSQPQRGPSACPESGRAATLRTPRFRCEGRLPSAARNEVRLRSESLRLGAATDTGSTPVASKVRPTHRPLWGAWPTKTSVVNASIRTACSGSGAPPGSPGSAAPAVVLISDSKCTTVTPPKRTTTRCGRGRKHDATQNSPSATCSAGRVTSNFTRRYGVLRAGRTPLTPEGVGASRVARLTPSTRLRGSRRGKLSHRSYASTAGGVGELAVSGTALGVRGEPEHRPRTRSTTLNERS